MSNAVAIQQTGIMATMAAKYDVPEATMLQTLKATAFRLDSGQVSDEQMTALLIVANQYGLNPFTKEIYAFPHKGSIVPIVGVDGWSRIINEHPMFDGLDFEQDAESCTCIIHRKDRAHPIKVTEYLSECKRDNAPPWKSHPKRMLRHKALIQCARLAMGYVGIYDEDEAERIIEKDVTPKAASAVGQAAIDAAQAEAAAGVSDQDRELAIMELELAANNGSKAFRDKWTSLSEAIKAAVGIPERNRIDLLGKESNKVTGEVIDHAG